MTKTLFERNDLKAATLLALYPVVEAQQQTEDDKTNKLVIVTQFGLVIAEKLLPNKFEDEKVNAENFLKFALQTSIKHRNEYLEEKANEEIFNNQTTSFLLENVKIKPFASDQFTNLQSMILFSDQIVGLTIGDIE
jgi:hypothetical protein